ncbi:MAG: MFS transporter [Desulfobacterales bacterium]|jgi:MFS family permease
MPSKKSPLKSNIFYGWYVLAASFVILFFTSGARFSIGVVFKPLMWEFGWDRGLISLAFLINMTVYAFSLIYAGKCYDRYGPKWVILVSNLFISAGFASLAFIDTFRQFFLFYGIIAAIGMGGTTVPLYAALLSKWFEKKRGFAVSLGLAGSSVGQFVLVPVFTRFVLQFGWRISYFWVGLVMLVVISVLALSIIKGDPHDLNLQPFGYKPGGRDEPKPGRYKSADLGLPDAVKTYSFWFFVTVMFICGSGDFLITTHLIPLVTDYNISPTTAGNMLAWLGLMSLAGILVAGPLSDKIGTKTPIALTFLMRFLLFVLILNYQNTAVFYVFACAFGFTLLVTAPLNAILVGKLYGFSHVGLISGLITTIHHMGGGLWTYISGEIFDRTGSYRPVFMISAILAIFAILSTLMIKEKRHRLAG